MKRQDRKETARRRVKADPAAEIDGFRARHLDLATREIMTADGVARVTVNDSESPLAWLARRKGRDGRSLITPNQFAAGERLRADFTRGNLSPRVTSNWGAPPRRGGAGGGGMAAWGVGARPRGERAVEGWGAGLGG
ncbi:DUF6456 domain-containing protein, partial [Rhodopseudomonas sp. BAL398]|uniref:DUF6456 domain-containing protein n=1 Tax=Rhodopseudomonas sp. BAL398 TaxID=3034676 RepID=UPI0023E1765E